MLLAFVDPGDRSTREYRAWRAKIRRERPVCELCNLAPSQVIAHKVQPMLGAGLMDEANVLALCKPCDRDNTRSNPVLRRRPLKRS